MLIDSQARYLKSHEWAKKESGNIFTIGLSAYAVEQLGDIVYMELPNVGRELAKDESFGVVESVKSASDMYSPLAGKVIDINKTVQDNPDSLKADAYNAGWLIKIETSDQTAFESLMDEKAYRTYLETEA